MGMADAVETEVMLEPARVTIPSAATAKSGLIFMFDLLWLS
jgi:hypothetical protein